MCQVIDDLRQFVGFMWVIRSGLVISRFRMQILFCEGIMLISLCFIDMEILVFISSYGNLVTLLLLYLLFLLFVSSLNLMTFFLLFNNQKLF